ncbi:MAG: hypothetical protein AABY83_07470 [Pseudomonadota bacterium]
MSATPLLSDIALDPQRHHVDDPMLADLNALTAAEGLATRSLGNTPVRNVVDPILTPSEDIPLLMDAIAVDPTPTTPALTSGDIPEVNSVMIPANGGPAEPMASAHSAYASPSRPGFATESRSAPPALSLVTKPRATMRAADGPEPDTASILSLVEDPGVMQQPSEATEVLDDAGLLALLNAPTQAVSAARPSPEDMPPDIALGSHTIEDANAAPDEPLEFSHAAPPPDFSEPPTSSTSQLIGRLTLEEQEIPELSLASLNLEESTPVAHTGKSAEPPSSSKSRSALLALQNSLDAAPETAPHSPINAAAHTLAGELQQQLYRKIDQLIVDTVDTLTRDLHTQLGSRIEAMVLATIDESLPPLLEQFARGLHNELRPKLQSKLPELLFEVLGKTKY